uniref:SHSP domain-containing protein n=1 Tax=Electrophorus electricus TaxID=8005 RepID=A0A4W4FGG6_ELEEL
MSSVGIPPSSPHCRPLRTVQQRPGYGWRPSLLYSQHFGLPPVLDSRDLLWLESVVRKLGDSSWPGYARASALAPPADQPGSKVHREMGGGLSEVYDQHGKWKVSLDVNHFAPSEIAVKMEGGFLEITGKHDERQDAHGYISRCFIRKYKLPVGVDAETIQSFLSGDGILSVEASFPDIPKPADVVIPVQVHYFNKFHFDVSKLELLSLQNRVKLFKLQSNLRLLLFQKKLEFLKLQSKLRVLPLQTP